MPKKTRREKVLAKERRLKVLQKTQMHVSENSIPAHERMTVESKVAEKVSPSYKVDDRTRTYFISDFKRSLFYISIIIALEIVVYFGTINNYFKF